jgi:hypothetical protein
MKSFEKELVTRFETEKVPEPNYNLMWKNIQQTEKRSKRTKQDSGWLGIAIAALLLLGVSLTVGKPYLAAASQSLVQLIFGSEEQVKKLDPYASEADLLTLEKDLQFAKQILSEKEWRLYSGLLEQSGKYMNKVTKLENGVRIQDFGLLTDKEKADLEQIHQELELLKEKLDHAAKLSIDKAKSLANFPITYPSYVPEGYVLQIEDAQMKETMSTIASPLIRLEYKKGEYGLYIFQSAAGEEGQFEHMFEQKKTYYHDGIEFIAGETAGSNVSGLKMVMPKSETTAAYQISIIADLLDKNELEKILLSTLNQ